MEAGLIALIVLVVILGVGTVVYMLTRKAGSKSRSTIGILHVTCRDSDGEPGLFLALNVPVEEIISEKQVLLDVNVIRQNSQK